MTDNPLTAADGPLPGNRRVCSVLQLNGTTIVQTEDELWEIKAGEWVRLEPIVVPDDVEITDLSSGR